MKKVVIRGPVMTQSGYGVHARQFVKYAMRKKDWEEKTGRPRISGSPKYKKQWFDYFNSFNYFDSRLKHE